MSTKRPKRHAVHKGTHYPKPNQEVERALMMLDGIRACLDMLELDKLDPARREGWAEQFGELVQAFEEFHRRLNREPVSEEGGEVISPQEFLRQCALWLAGPGALHRRQDVAERMSRNMVSDIDTNTELSAHVYGVLLPQISKADDAPWEAVRAALSLGLLLEERRRISAIKAWERRKEGDKKRQKIQRWLAEVESKPSWKSAAAVREEIAEREGRRVSTVERGVTKARRKRRDRQAAQG